MNRIPSRPALKDKRERNAQFFSRPLIKYHKNKETVKARRRYGDKLRNEFDMKKTVHIILIIMLVMFVFSGCADAKEQNTGYTFTDDLGRTVTVSSYERTAALLGSYADIWILSGGSVCAAADDAWDDFDLELSEDTVNLGGTKSLSLEKLLGANPDFVIASTNTPRHLEWQKSLEDAGIATAYFDVSELDDYLRMLKICTDITGNTRAYEEYGVKVKARAEEIIARNKDKEPQSVLVMRASAGFIRAKNSGGTVLGGMLKDFGCVNIADDDNTLLDNLGIESISIFNPNKIFFIQSGDDEEGMKKAVQSMFAENPLWTELDAVKNGDVYFMDKRLYNFKPNARWAEAYEKLEEILYED